MRWTKKLSIVACVIFLIVIAAGCETKVFFTGQINPIEKEKIVTLQINKGGNSYQKEFNDIDTIIEIINNLNNVKVRKLSIAEEETVLDNGNVFNKDSTIIINLFTDKGKEYPQSIAILISERELYLPDVKSMKGSRTLSYISDIDETTLKSIKALYSIVEKITK